MWWTGTSLCSDSSGPSWSSSWLRFVNSPAMNNMHPDSHTHPSPASDKESSHHTQDLGGLADMREIRNKVVKVIELRAAREREYVCMMTRQMIRG